MNQEEGPHQMRPPWCLHPELPSLQNCEKPISVVYKLPSLWYFVIAAQTLKHCLPNQVIFFPGNECQK